MKRVLTLIICIVLTAAISIGGTIALLQDRTKPLVNTFTFGNVTITLTQEGITGPQTINAGGKYGNNPVFTVNANSEASYLFIQIKEENNALENGGKFVNYTFDTSTETNGVKWTKLTTTAEDGDVYYYEMANATDASALVFNKLFTETDGKIYTTANYKNGDVDALGTKNPTISITGYAVEKTIFATETDPVSAAWAIAKNIPEDSQQP